MSHKIIHCRWLLPITSPPIEDGALWIVDGKIKAFGNRKALSLPARVPVIDLENTVVLPGFINAHCHLELAVGKTIFNDVANQNAGFTAWLRNIIAYQAAITPVERLIGLAEHLDALRKSGVTAIADHMASHGPLDAVLAAPLRGRIFMEVLGANPVVAQTTLHNIETRLSTLSPSSHWSVHPSPHSVHAVAPSALERILGNGDFFSLHLGESDEEAACFRTHDGPLMTLLKERGGTTHWNAPSAIAYLALHNLLRHPMLIVHGNTVTEDDLRHLHPKRHFFVHCPGSHAYFNHPRFPLEQVESHGFTVAIGTDSWSSNRLESYLDELRLFSDTYSHKIPAAVIEHATMGGAQALHLNAIIGSLDTGKDADLIGVPYTHGDPHISVLEAKQVSWSFQSPY